MPNLPHEVLNELAQLKSYCQRLMDRFLAVNERDANNKQSLNLLSLHAFEAAKSVAAAAELTKETLRQCAAVALTHAGSPVTDAAIAAVKAAEIATQAAMKAAAAAAFVAAAASAAARIEPARRCGRVVRLPRRRRSAIMKLSRCSVSARKRR